MVHSLYSKRVIILLCYLSRIFIYDKGCVIQCNYKLSLNKNLTYIYHGSGNNNPNGIEYI